MRDFAVIFDMDGTLVDTLSVNFRFWSTYLEQFGVKPEKDLFVSLLGKPVESVAKVFKETMGVDIHAQQMAEAISEQRLIYYSTHDLLISSALVPLLQSLKQHKVPLAVGTGSGKRITSLLLTHNRLLQYFDAIVTSDDVQHDKPAPDTYLLAAQKLGSKPSQCVVVEDAGNGIIGAQAAGMKTVGYVNGFNSHETVAASDIVVDDYAKLSFETLRSLVTHA